MKRYIVAILALASVANASAEYSNMTEFEIRSQSRGTLLNRDVMSISELGSLSQSQFQFGSARSMAMAGALTSLGGDATSMLINPAGLGMARTGSVTLTPMITVQRSESMGSSSDQGGGRTPFALSNFAAVINLYENGAGGLVSLNLGLGYNKISDLNYNYALSSLGASSSIARLFSRQLTQSGTELSELYKDNNPDWNSLPSNLWGAALGYKSGLTFQNYGSTPSGYYDKTPNGSAADNYREPISDLAIPIWNSTWIANDASVDQYMSVESDGSVGEYDIALGANIDNKIYVGLTLGVQSVNQRLDLIYEEGYNNPDSFNADNELLYTNYNQTIITSGSGVNVKVGVTYRPMEELRIGVAYHSPTYYSLNRQYQGSMASSSIFNGEDESEMRYALTDSPVLEDFYENKWKYRTASKILVGGSYTFNKRALISVDYQYENFGSTTMRDVPYGVSMDLYDNIDDIYQGVNTLRVGGEYKINASLALRGGYGFSSSMVRDDISTAQLLDIPATDKVRYFATGIGYAVNSMFSLDLTYMNYCSTTTNYSLFYSEGSFDAMSSSAALAQSNSFSTKIKQHNIALSMLFKM